MKRYYLAPCWNSDGTAGPILIRDRKAKVEVAEVYSSRKDAREMAAAVNAREAKGGKK